MDKNYITPIEKRGKYWFKREDLFKYAGVNGAKVRDCLYLLKGKKPKGLVTTGSRESPQINIVAHIAHKLGISCHAHTPDGELKPELKMAQKLGTKIIQHRARYNVVLQKRARDEAEKLGWQYIPFAMECSEAVESTKNQVKNIPKGVKRIIVPCGSGMNLCGILKGLKENNLDIPVLGVACGKPDIVKNLNKYGPIGWKKMVKIVKASVRYQESMPNKIEGIVVDPIYEAKAIPFLRPGDLFWIIGIRKTINESQ
jgi:1-aminocyclopropane-1-carboxylate deaminase/D-cysteine desulfhydrase-like pyridoxal-dependent ACC family enzyme